MTGMHARGRRGGAALATLVLALLVSVTGCSAVTSAAAPTSSTATGSTTASPSPDLSIRRAFTLSDGSTEQGCLTLSVTVGPSTAGSGSAGNLAAARAILADPRWRTEPVSLAEVPAADLTRMKARGETEAVILAGVLKDHIQEAIEQAGVEGGVSTSGFVGCR
ncbi:hypothetical protein ABCS02_31425 [Microbacterium sp. X-17]|uniref:hypothetical protein n=1 Tax=Microbacterium sp. X-17 TaxID=3144404 RepID=UPI0031F4A6DA